MCRLVEVLSMLSQQPVPVHLHFFTQMSGKDLDHWLHLRVMAMILRLPKMWYEEKSWLTFQYGPSIINMEEITIAHEILDWNKNHITNLIFGEFSIHLDPHHLSSV